jgi:hypothetical protein
MESKQKTSPAIQQILIAGVAIALLVLGGKVLKAFNPQPDPPCVWGMFGITPSETARLNVVNIRLPGIPPGPCSVQLNFFNDSGKLLKQRAVVLNPGQAAFLDIAGVEAGGAFRNEMHPYVLLATGSPVGCNAVSTLELFDTASGKTSILAHPIFVPAQVAQ